MVLILISRLWVMEACMQEYLASLCTPFKLSSARLRDCYLQTSPLAARRISNSKRTSILSVIHHQINHWFTLLALRVYMTLWELASCTLSKIHLSYHDWSSYRISLACICWLAWGLPKACKFRQSCWWDDLQCAAQQGGDTITEAEARKAARCQDLQVIGLFETLDLHEMAAHTEQLSLTCI